jgi:hypothetical protein
MVAMSRLCIGSSTTVVGAVAIAAMTALAQQPPVPANPQTAREWRQVGAARRQAKDYDGAIAAFQASLKLEPDAATAMFALGAVYAAKGEATQSLEWLARAKSTHRVDMTQMEADSDLKPRLADSRFAALLPAPEDFEHPFVEPVSVLREWDGEAMNDQFGWIARNIGDVDGDRVADIVTSAPTKDVGGANAGKIYVYSTGTKHLLWSVDGRPGDQLGTGVEGAGDTNGDGVPDVIASAPGAGEAFVYSGKDGRVLLTMKADRKTDDFGRHAAGVGDVDGDGRADVIVGAPGARGSDSGPGHAYVYSGKDGHRLLTLTGERGGDQFGSAVAGATINKRKFLVVGAPAAGASKHGRVYVYTALAASPAFVIDADETGNALGAMFLAVIGDVDADGVPDVYASDWSNSAKGPSTGRIFVHSGKDGRRLLTLTGETAGEGFGTSPSNAGDVDGDGHDDLIVGAWQYAGAAVSGGRAYLYSGKDGRLMKTFTCRTPGDTFGFDSVAMGDIDKDGSLDFLITSAWSGIHHYHSGRVFIISSGIRR